MKYVCKCEVIVLNKIKEPRYNDKENFNYHLLIMQDTDAGSVYVSKDIFEKAIPGQKMNIIAEYNPNVSADKAWMRFMIKDIEEINAKK